MRPLTLLSLCLLAFPLRADGPSDNVPEKVRPVPPLGANVPEAVRAELSGEADRLRSEIEKLRVELQGKASALALLPDLEIFHKAVDWAVRYGEIFNPTNEVPAARSNLVQGFQRLQELREGRPSWTTTTGLVVRGYLSALDGSVQPYGLVVPATFQTSTPHRYRLDLWFHGRDEKLTELNFLSQRQRSNGEFTPPNTIVLHTYSRFCNGQKLAGEVDVFEALAEVKRRYPIDDERIVVRGFSLGGAAAWHIAAHYPGLWAAAAPGAGFSETPEFLKVFQNEKMQPAWYEQALWRQYNATDYALNFFNLPLVAYSGELDAQKQAADIMAKALAAENLALTHIIGPGTRHSYHPGSKMEINRRIDAIAARGRDLVPNEVRFTTWTLRYNSNHWVTIDGMEKHWERARVEADIVGDNSIRLKTRNITGVTLSMHAGRSPFDPQQPVKVVINGKKVLVASAQSDRSWSASFHNAGRRWKEGAAKSTTLAKRHRLQGPIDDAFLSSFLVVRPTGTSSHPKLQAWVDGELARFTNEWRRHFRGDVRMKDDTAVGTNDIAQHNLIVWGDPQSNALLGRIKNRLPLRWDAKSIVTGSKTFEAAHHVPLVIYPNPLNPERYVVLNSGFTFREYDYLNNARQVPKLPDWAIVDLNTAPSSRWPGKIAEAGFFGERWEMLENSLPKL